MRAQEIYSYVTMILVPCAVVLPIIQLLLVLVQWYPAPSIGPCLQTCAESAAHACEPASTTRMGIFKLYKTRLLAMRRGEYFFERQMYTQYKANRYLGYQVTGMTIQYLMTLVIMIIIIVPLVVLVVLLVLPTTGHARSGA